MTRLEGLCADAWPAPVDRRARGVAAAGRRAGFTGRANAALAIGDPGGPVPAALAAVREFAAEHGIPARVQAPIGSPWDRAVAGRAGGSTWRTRPVAVVAVLVGDLAGSRNPIRRVELAPTRPTPAWWRLGPADPPTVAAARR